MNYPRRYRYHGIRAHQHWMKDVLQWRAWNRSVIAQLGGKQEAYGAR